MNWCQKSFLWSLIFFISVCLFAGIFFYNYNKTTVILPFIVGSLVVCLSLLLLFQNKTEYFSKDLDEWHQAEKTNVFLPLLSLLSIIPLLLLFGILLGPTIFMLIYFKGIGHKTYIAITAAILTCSTLYIFLVIICKLVLPGGLLLWW